MIGLNKSWSIGKGYLRPLLKYYARYLSTQPNAAQNAAKKSGSGWKYLAIFAIGATGAYFVADKFDLRNRILGTKPSINDGGPLLKLDLNEIYETGAVMFMTNKEVKFIKKNWCQNLNTFHKDSDV
jgi:hypothetical protein